MKNNYIKHRKTQKNRFSIPGAKEVPYMDTVKNEKKGVRMGILIKISGITTVSVLLTVVVLAITGIISMQDVSLQTAVMMGKEKIKGDIASFRLMIGQAYGELTIKMTI
jgi:hypothetical protein